METLSVQEAKSESMGRPSLLRVGTFLVVKYYAFFIILAFIGARFQKAVLANSRGASEVLANTFFYFVYISWAVLLLGLALVLPFYFVLRIRAKAILLSCLAALLLAECCLYTWSASTSDFSNGLYNTLVTMVFLLLFFKSILANALNR